MATVARDGLDILRIPRKAILRELVKKLGGSEVQYKCSFDDGRYWCVAGTIIATEEVDTPGKLEEAMGCFEATETDAEEAAAVSLIEALKRTYRFEIDDMNFVKRARAEHRNEQVERDLSMGNSIQNRQNEIISQLNKGWNKLLDDMEFVHEVCEDVCGSGLATLNADCGSDSHANTIYAVYCLSEWTEQKIYESTANLNGVGK